MAKIIVIKSISVDGVENMYVFYVCYVSFDDFLFSTGLLCSTDVSVT